MVKGSEMPRTPIGAEEPCGCIRGIAFCSAHMGREDCDRCGVRFSTEDDVIEVEGLLVHAETCLTAEEREG